MSFLVLGLFLMVLGIVSIVHQHEFWRIVFFILPEVNLQIFVPLLFSAAFFLLGLVFVVVAVFRRPHIRRRATRYR